MSNIYIQEPPTNGKVLLTTSVGELDVELWTKEAPKACRNFVQLCMEGYYDGTIFHRVVKDFIVQGGDPTGTGTGGESIYGGPFKDEFHSRLRFVRRGLVAMANIGPHTNGSQFFFTMAPTPKLQNKHTIFGKVTGQTIYNMIRLHEIETGENDRPVEPHMIIKTEMLANPFDDIVPRPNMKRQKKVKEERKRKTNSKATKNFSLLSFGEEAEEDEERTFKASKKFSGKSKSSHDLIDDPNLSSVPVTNKADKKTVEEMEEGLEMPEDTVDEKQVGMRKDDRVNPGPPNDHDGDQEELSVEEEKKKKRDETKQEARRLQRELKASKLREKTLSVASEKKEDLGDAGDDKESIDISGEPDFLEKFKLERQKFKELQKMQKKKGTDREAQTLAMLSKFQSKLSSVQKLASGYPDSEGEEEKQKEEDENEDDDDLSWMRHTLQFDGDKKQKVLDANVEDSERYEIFDPRNPMTKRRRDASKKKAKTNN